MHPTLQIIRKSRNINQILLNKDFGRSAIRSDAYIFSVPAPTIITTPNFASLDRTTGSQQRVTQYLGPTEHVMSLSFVLNRKAFLTAYGV